MTDTTPPPAPEEVPPQEPVSTPEAAPTQPVAETPPPAPSPTPAPEAATVAPPAAPVEDQSAKELMENIDTSLIVELGRANMTVMAIGQLKEGNVIELNRSPAEPVDLIVGGKRIGKGELVEIEGELGVRILSIVK